MTLSEEEANAKLERLQQQLTLNLQAIDKNFAECNQVLTSRLIPEIERYSEATHQIWNHCKIWLYFFRSMDREENQYQFSVVSGEDGTNRPAHDSLSDRFSRMSHDVTMKDITEVSAQNRLGQSRLRMNFRRNQSNDEASRAGKDTFNADILDSGSSTYSSRHSKSPPRLIPYAMTPEMLQRTPIREAADLFTKDQFRNAGASTSSDDDSQYKYHPDMEADKGKGRAEEPPRLHRETNWGHSNVMDDDSGNRHIFENFMDNRTRHHDQIENRISDSRAGGMRSPSDRYQSKMPKSIHMANARDSFIPEPLTFTPSDAGSRVQTPLQSSSNNITPNITQTKTTFPSPFSNIPISQSNRQLNTPFRTPLPPKKDNGPLQPQQTPSSFRKNILNDLSSADSFSIADGSAPHRMYADDAQLGNSPSTTPGHDFAQRLQNLKTGATPPQSTKKKDTNNKSGDNDPTVPYEFSDPLRNIPESIDRQQRGATTGAGSSTPGSTLEERYARYKNRESVYSGSFSSADMTSMSNTSANMTMISGLTGQIPARFDLKYFPEDFRQPPASTQLTRIHNFFADRPGMMLTADMFLEHVNYEYEKDYVQLLIHLLARKKFLKRIGDKKKGAWTIRR